MIKNKYTLAILLLAIFTLMACSEVDLREPGYSAYQNLADRFDFKTTETFPLSINAPAGSYVALYERDPEKYTEAQPFYSTFVDGEGHFKENIQAPQHLIDQEIYVKANGNVFKSTLNKKGINYSPVASRANNTSSIKVNYADNIRIKEYFDRIMIKNKNNSKLVDTSRAGVDVETMDDNTEVVFSLVNVTGRYMMQLYYFYYPVDRTNPGQSSFEDENKMAEFIKRFMRPEFCLSRKWENKYTGFNNLAEKNLSLEECGAKYGDDASGWINRNYAEYLNSEQTTVKLNYYGWFNSRGEFEKIDKPVTTFPAAYKIGFFMYVAVPSNNNWVKPNSEGQGGNERYYEDINKTSKHYVISTDRIINYEIIPQKEHGEIVAEPFVHYDRMCATRLLSYNTNGMPCIVYGMEDDLTGKSDSAYDFNDVFFTVQTNPIVDISDIPVIGEGSYAYEGTLLYEDLYPLAGDYDMNDVIIEYRYIMYYEHYKEGNKVTSINYEFTPVWNGATYISDFYLNVKQEGLGDQQIKICENVNSIANANAAKIRQNIAAGKPITEGLTEFTGTLDKNSTLNTSGIIGQLVRDLDLRYKIFDPFIYVTNTNYEVHTPGNVAVLPGSNKSEDPLLKYYHVGAEDVFYAKGLETPFAVNIALRSFDTEPGFQECDETYTINSCYAPHYANWVATKGEKSKNWYMRYNYKSPRW